LLSTRIENRRQNNLTSDFSGLICASHTNSSSAEKLKRFHRSEEQNPQMLAYLVISLTNFIYTKLTTSLQERISSFFKNFSIVFC